MTDDMQGAGERPPAGSQQCGGLPPARRYLKVTDVPRRSIWCVSGTISAGDLRRKYAADGAGRVTEKDELPAAIPPDARRLLHQAAAAGWGAVLIHGRPFWETSHALSHVAADPSPAAGAETAVIVTEPAGEARYHWWPAGASENPAPHALKATRDAITLAGRRPRPRPPAGGFPVPRTRKPARSRPRTDNRTVQAG